MLLEVIATCADDILRAAEGGADRVELLTGMQEGGMTPSVGLIEEAVGLSVLPVHVMIRPHSRSFVYDRYDLRAMIRDVKEARRARAAGIVVGALTAEGRVNKAALLPILEEAGEMNVTFHRAFDEARDLEEALEDLLTLQRINRILTSGGKSSVLDAEETIARLAKRLHGTSVRLLAGSGLTPDTVADFVRNTGVEEVHFGRGVRYNGQASEPIDPRIVRGIKLAVGERERKIIR
ncbi:copper homeostasis protein CutC [Cohnella thermotolerans]|uniref:copper homeostasis protein CutC n=1 Tax=Cohnella thermotolerans TaxID=329858 RepID=UPI0003F86E21|nr:copper homeostasis protein CutC [Cohnella thermotolerans]